MDSASIHLISPHMIFVQLRSHFIIFSVAYSALRLLSESIEILEKTSQLRSIACWMIKLQSQSEKPTTFGLFI